MLATWKLTKPRSKIHNPLFAAQVGGLVRATLSAKIQSVHQSRGKVYYANTDGLVCTVSPEKFGTLVSHYDQFLASTSYRDELWQMRAQLKEIFIINSRFTLGKSSCDKLPGIITLPGYTPTRKAKAWKLSLIHI